MSITHPAYLIVLYDVEQTQLKLEALKSPEKKKLNFTTINFSLQDHNKDWRKDRERENQNIVEAL